MASALDTVYYYVAIEYDYDGDIMEYYDTYEEAKQAFEEEKQFFGLLTPLKSIRLCSRTAYLGSTKVLKKYTYDDYVDDKYGAYTE